MTVKEMMDILSQLNPDQDVTVWNPEWDDTNNINGIEVNEDNEVVLY